MNLLIPTTAFLIALCFGSFTNVLIYRIPLGLNIALPASHCPECKHKLKLLENIPLLSYLLQVGQCRNCGSKISTQYPLIEALVALLSLPYIYLFAYLSFEPLALLTSFTLISCFTALAVIDLKQQILPLELSYSLILLGLLIAVLQSTLITTIASIAACFFCFDAFTHFVNMIFLREEAEAISPPALCFTNKFLERHISYIYLILLSLIAYFLYFNQTQNLQILMLLLGISYIYFELIQDFILGFWRKTTQAKIDNTKSSALGGGDIAMLAAIAALFSFKLAVIVYILANYLSLTCLVIKALYQAISKRQKFSISEKQIPLGLSLAVSLFAVMILKVLVPSLWQILLNN